jgi:Calcineurin-like phosphoesterase
MKTERWVICNDQHTPWHDEVVHAAFLRFLKKYPPDGFVINGDFMDGFSFSRHLTGAMSLEMPDKQMMTIEKEITPANDVLDDYDQVLPKGSRKYFIFGNHEDRIRRWASQGLNSVFGNFLNPRRLLNLDRRGYITIENYPSGYVEIGNLQVSHGSKATVNVAKANLDEYRHSIATGHAHTAQLAYVGGIGAKQVGITIPCMADMQSKGMEYQKNTGRSVQGWLVVNVEGKKFWPELILGYEKRFFYAGKEI